MLLLLSTLFYRHRGLERNELRKEFLPNRLRKETPLKRDSSQFLNKYFAIQVPHRVYLILYRKQNKNISLHSIFSLHSKESKL